MGIRIAKFRKNTDSTSQKGRSRIDLAVSAPAVSVPAAAVRNYYTDVAVQKGGVFFERAIVLNSINGKRTPTNYLVYEEDDFNYIISIRQINNSTYRLQIAVQNADEESAHTSRAISANAALYLAVSPFD